jgi:hypothetical protein
MKLVNIKLKIYKLQLLQENARKQIRLDNKQKWTCRKGNINRASLYSNTPPPLKLKEGVSHWEFEIGRTFLAWIGSQTVNLEVEKALALSWMMC